jgi:hypothetical protein
MLLNFMKVGEGWSSIGIYAMNLQVLTYIVNHN